MKKSIVKLFVGFGALLLILSAASVGNAQRRGRGANNYGSYTRAQVDRIIKNVEERTDHFVSQFNKSLDRSRLDGTMREDVLNKRARDLESATDELRREFDRNDSLAENRDEVRRCLNVAADINATMRRRKFSGNAENNWANVRAELNALAKVYNLPGFGSGAY